MDLNEYLKSLAKEHLRKSKEIILDESFYSRSYHEITIDIIPTTEELKALGVN